MVPCVCLALALAIALTFAVVIGFAAFLHIVGLLSFDYVYSRSSRRIVTHGHRCR